MKQLAMQRVPRRPSPLDEGEAARHGMLVFLGCPTFEFEWWTEDGLYVLHTLELDLVVADQRREVLAQKVGELILDLLASLEEDDDLTPDEVEIRDLILSRLVPPWLKYHRRARREKLARDIRAWLRGSFDWRWGPPSTHAGSEAASHA